MPVCVCHYIYQQLLVCSYWPCINWYLLFLGNSIHWRLQYGVLLIDCVKLPTVNSVSMSSATPVLLFVFVITLCVCHRYPVCLSSFPHLSVIITTLSFPYVFVIITLCVCHHYSLYLSSMPRVFVIITLCACYHYRVCLSSMPRVFVITTHSLQQSGWKIF